MLLGLQDNGIFISRNFGGNLASPNSDSRGFGVTSMITPILTTDYYNGGAGWWIGAIAIGGLLYTASLSDRECRWASIGTGLSDTEVADYYADVQAYQTALGRNV